MDYQRDPFAVLRKDSELEILFSSSRERESQNDCRTQVTVCSYLTVGGTPFEAMQRYAWGENE